MSGLQSAQQVKTDPNLEALLNGLNETDKQGQGAGQDQGPQLIGVLKDTAEKMVAREKSITWFGKIWRKIKEIFGITPFVKTMHKALFLVLLKAKGERHLEYSDGAIGITGLLYCPQKVDLRKEFPDIETMNLEIADGYAHERDVYEALLDLYGPVVVKKETVLPYVSPQGLKVEGHADIVIYGKNKVVCIECKATKFAYHSLPFNSVKDDEILIWQPKLIECINFSDGYIEQSKIQKLLLQKMYPGMEVEHYILEKTMMKFAPIGLKKIYILRKTEENMSTDELEALITKYKTDKDPRYTWECSYCGFFKEGVCPGKEIVEKITNIDLLALSPVVQAALQKYSIQYGELKDTEDFLKRELKGKRVRIGNGKGMEVGYVPDITTKWNLEKVAQAARHYKFKLLPFLQVNWRERDGLENLLSTYGDLSEYRTIEQKTKWKGLVK